MSNRKNTKQLVSVAVLALMFGAAVAQPAPGATSASSSTSTPNSRSGTSAGMTGTSQAGASSTMSKSDQKMLHAIAQANMAEIEAGKLAQNKTQDERVKSFSQQMVDDHTKALQEVQQLAQSKGVTLPTEPDSKHLKMAEKLNKLSGSDFDKRYLKQGGLSDHKETHRLLQRVQKRADDPELKSLAAKSLPTIEQHLSMAKDMHDNRQMGRTSGRDSMRSIMESSGSATDSNKGSSSPAMPGVGGAGGGIFSTNPPPRDSEAAKGSNSSTSPMPGNMR